MLPGPPDSLASDPSRALYTGERRNNANKPITSILRNRRERRGARGGEETYSRARERGGGGKIVRVYRGQPREQPRATGNVQHECMRGALGNDIGIMAEHGTNEMTNGPTDWNRGPGPGIGGPGPHPRRATGVIIQANKGRSRQDYRVPRAASHPVASGPPRFLPVCP